MYGVQRQVLEPAFGALRHVEEEARWFFNHGEAVRGPTHRAVQCRYRYQDSSIS
jgi:hypothetical protein